MFETVRQQLVRQEIAEAEGEAEEPDEAELRGPVRGGPRGPRGGLLRLHHRARPGDRRRRARPAHRRPGRLRRGRRAVPEPVHAGRARGPRGAGRDPRPAGRGHRRPRSRTPASPSPSPRSGGVVVTFVGGTVYPPFEEVRPQLEQEAADAADDAGARAGRRRPRGPRRHGEPALRRARGRASSCRATAASSTSSSDEAAPDAAAERGHGGAAETDRVPVALVVTVSSRLPGLLGPAGWRAVVRRAAARRTARGRGHRGGAAGRRLGRSPTSRTPRRGLPGERRRPRRARTRCPPGAEVVDGAPEPAGARLLDVVAVMDRLRSPGGCPWDAEQTHSSLRGYLLEEAHEAYDAIVDDDPAAMREELGDVLLQVVFHARVAAEAAAGPPVRHRRRRRRPGRQAGPPAPARVRGRRARAMSRRSRPAGRRSSRRRSSGARRPRASPARSRRPPGVPRWCGGRAGRACRPRSPPSSTVRQPGGARGAAARGRHRRRAARLGRRGRPPRGGPPLRRGTGRRGRGPRRAR